MSLHIHPVFRYRSIRATLLFMLSALLSFLSIRLERSTARLERWAEVIFIFALVTMTLIAVVFAFEIV